MSGFMNYLDKINALVEKDNDIVEEIKESTVINKSTSNKSKTQIKKQRKNVDASVSLIEKRMRTKLDDVGLNSKVINEVISYVLSNVESVKDLKRDDNIMNSHKNTEVQRIHEYKHNNDIAGAASHILEGVSGNDIAKNISYNDSDNNSNVNSNFGPSSNVADHASSLL